MLSLLATIASAIPLPLIWFLTFLARAFSRRRGVTIVLSISDSPSPPSRISSAACALSLRRAGADIIVATPEARDLAALIEKADGVLLSGGEDTGSGEPSSGSENPARDEMELALVAAALERGIPILGICRGMQILALAAGGTVETHKHDPERLRGHKSTMFNPILHDVEVLPGTKLLDAVGKNVLKVFSIHHNHVADTGSAIVSAKSRGDGMTEGLEFPGRAFVVGIQWHPEIRSILKPSNAAEVQALVDMAAEGKKNLEKQSRYLKKSV